MNVLLVGSGGRECAFAWKLSQSPIIRGLYIAPGNPGTESYGTNVPIDMLDFDTLGTFCKEKNIELVVVGPEAPLVKGIYDYFAESNVLKHISVIGPSRKGALLEGSKNYSKEFMKKYGIPTANFATFRKETIKNGYLFLESLQPPYVLKADGLAAGKGVLIVNNLSEAKEILHQMLIQESFGEASKSVVVEEYLPGIELSVFVLTDGVNYVILPEAKDYKRIGEGDTGLNTGGMGAVSPVPFANADFMNKVKDTIIEPTIHGIRRENIVYKGFIFFGLMNVNGNPYVIEYNCRMGDPETEVVLPRIDSDLLELLLLVKNEKLGTHKLKINNSFATTIVCVAEGYPNAYTKGHIISGTEALHDILLFHAGTTVKNGNLVTHGGRVLACTGMGENLPEALQKSLSAADKIQYHGKYFRRDIGKDLI